MSSKFGQGFGFLQQQQKEAAERKASGGGGGFNNKPKMYKLWLKPGESARLYWVTDHQDIRFPLVHGKTFSTKPKNGEKARTFKVDKLCGRYNYAEDRSVCKLCMDQKALYEKYPAGEEIPELERIGGPWTRTVGIVWVKYIAHQTMPEGKNWKKQAARGSNDVFYIEEINDYRLLIMKDKITAQIRKYLEGDPLEEDVSTVDTLLDVEWRYSSTLAGDAANSRMDTLEPVKSSTVPEEMEEIRKNVPDIDEVILAEYGDSPRQSPSGSGHTTEKGLAKELDIDDYGESDDSDLEFK